MEHPETPDTFIYDLGDIEDYQEPAWCHYCGEELIDPAVAPYCSIHCAVASSEDW